MPSIARQPGTQERRPLEYGFRVRRDAAPRNDCGQGSECPEAENAVDRVDAGDDAFADQLAQCLRGAAAQRAVAGAAVEARYRVFVGKAVATMHLDRLTRH